MPVTHVNRKRDTYYLHTGKTKTGKPRYWFSTKIEGDLVDAMPEGYEIYENPDAQVFLRKIVPQLVTPVEIAVVEEGLKRYAPGQNCVVDVQRKQIVIYHAERGNFTRKCCGSHWMTRRTELSESSVGVSRSRLTTGSTSGCRVVSGNCRFWSRPSAHTSVGIPSTI